ncbi:Oxygen-evolving enhancer protein 3 [Dillenia turbinata]|uniref:Oxygen-evolving enhancer protein 3 n=1 Tax=Dillenia turbinata TaxID=194707 RepID=A0AAN8V762_9MAGN
MSTIPNLKTLVYHHITTVKHQAHQRTPPQATVSGKQTPLNGRRNALTTLLTTSLALVGLQATPIALAEKWGVRSFIWERYFEPGLSPEDAVARIKQTREGMHSMRHMLDTMSWRYILKYIRLKNAYLGQDMKTAVLTLPQSRRESYIKTANELVDNMAELDYYVRTPKVYESYVFYEKTLKSLDDLVALLA